ncbi:hypothetical protein PSM7751_00848 [Pseudooceanicola marinus]|uniref:Uncharacterized protein n=1 Tax=Pseudooceanicola marinus TaxID=396013 RepID=A0A1X6YLA5_9RHOB|nr:hypothetical protein [Pseudooceanicola marinus]SLN24713.1 hypothetical protein PSM7751_00848 [Pseudooceanicola marinus]
MTEITRNARFVSANGGKVDIIDLQSGEVLADVSVPPGIQPTGPYLDLVPYGAQLQVGPESGLAVLEPRSLTSISKSPLRHQSGANPDFQPTSASRMERELRLQIARMKSLNDGAERRQRKLDQIERIPNAPMEDPAPVVEPSPAPAPEPNPEPAPEPQPEGGNE